MCDVICFLLTISNTIFRDIRISLKRQDKDYLLQIKKKGPSTKEISRTFSDKNFIVFFFKRRKNADPTTIF